MIKKGMYRLREFKAYLGVKVFFLMIVTALLGFFWFFLESFFLVIVQGFLISIGIELGTQKFLPNWYPADLVTNILFLACFGFFRGMIIFFRAYFAGMTGITFVNDKRTQIIAKALHEKNIRSISEIIDIFNDKIFQSGVVLQDITQSLYLTCLLVSFCALGFYIAPVEFIVAASCFAITILNQKFVQKEISKSSHGIWSSWRTIFNTLYWGLHNNFLLKLYGLEAKETARAQAEIARYFHFYKDYYKIIGLRAALTNILAILIISGLTYLSISILKTEPLKLVGLFYLFLRVSGNAAELNGHINNIRMYLPYFNQVKDYLEVNTEVVPTLQTERKPSETFEYGIKIEVRNLSFSYDANPLLENINFQVGSSQILLIKGQSGSGKSTLLSLLFGLLPLTNGIILYNTKNLNEVRSALFDVIGYVGPEPFLMTGTVKDNLLYMNPRTDIVESEIWAALKHAQIQDLVLSFKGKLNEFLNEKTQVSTGQKQRLAIARALLRNPKILILDEATANLDMETERKIIELIRSVAKDTIVVIVSHKDSFDSIADIRLELGKRTILSAEVI